MENANKMVRSSWKAWYAGEADATYVRVECGSYVAIAIYNPKRPTYTCEVYLKTRSGLEDFLGYEVAVCLHPGPMMLAVNAARPVWATQANHTKVNM